MKVQIMIYSKISCAKRTIVESIECEAESEGRMRVEQKSKIWERDGDGAVDGGGEREVSGVQLLASSHLVLLLPLRRPEGEVQRVQQKHPSQQTHPSSIIHAMNMDVHEHHSFQTSKSPRFAISRWEMRDDHTWARSDPPGGGWPIRGEGRVPRGSKRGSVSLLFQKIAKNGIFKQKIAILGDFCYF